MSPMDHDKELPMTLGGWASRRGETQAFHASLAIVVNHQDIEVFAQQLSERKSCQRADVLVMVSRDEIMEKQANLRLRGGEEFINGRRVRQLFRRFEGCPQENVTQSAGNTVHPRGRGWIGLGQGTRGTQAQGSRQMEDEALVKLRLADGEAKLEAGPLRRDKLMLKIEAMEKESKDADDARTHPLMSRGTKLRIGGPLGGVKPRDSVVTRHIRAGPEGPDGIEKLGRLGGKEVITLVMGLVNSRLPRASLAGLASASEAIQTECSQRAGSVLKAGGIRGSPNRLHDLRTRMLRRIRRSSNRFHRRRGVDVLKQPALVTRAKQRPQRGLRTGEVKGGVLGRRVQRLP